MRQTNIGLWLSVFAGVLFTLALVVTLTPGGNVGVIHLNDAILASDLNSTNSEVDNWVATYDAASGGFTWETAPIAAHATAHEDSGSDEIDVVGLSGLLADDQHVLDAEVLAVAAAISHNTTHENAGGDEISVVGLSGLLADDQHVLDAEVISAIEAGTLSTVDIDGGTINGITDLALVDGGTGASNAGDARSNLGVDAAGTDNSTDVTLAGALDYITIIGQAITRNAVDLTTDTTGDLAVDDGGTGASSFTDHGVMVGSGAGALSVTAVGTTGQVFTGVTGSDPIWAAAGGGITGSDQWRLHTDFTGTGYDPIASNLERVDTDGFGKIGAGMSESSGVFTFPETGIWMIEFHVGTTSSSGSDASIHVAINTTLNDSAYSVASISYASLFAGSALSSVVTSFMFDVTATATHKASFAATGVGPNTTVKGDSGVNETWMTFIRLGDT